MLIWCIKAGSVTNCKSLFDTTDKGNSTIDKVTASGRSMEGTEARPSIDFEGYQRGIYLTNSAVTLFVSSYKKDF